MYAQLAYHEHGQLPLSEIRDVLGWRCPIADKDPIVALMILCDRLEAAEKRIAELQGEIDTLNSSAIANDLRWQKAYGKPTEDWEANILKEYEG